MLRFGQLSHDLAITLFYRTRNGRFLFGNNPWENVTRQTVEAYDQVKKTVESGESTELLGTLSKETRKSLQAKSATQQKQQKTCERKMCNGTPERPRTFCSWWTKRTCNMIEMR
jgi:hypothetical protein